MLNRKFLYLTLLLAGICLFTWILFKPSEFQRTIELPVKSENIVQLFLQPQKLKQWYQPFATRQSEQGNSIKVSRHGLSSEDRSVSIIHATAMGIKMESRSAAKRRQFLFQIVPAAVSPISTRIVLRYRSSKFQQMIRKDSLTEEALASLQELKSYCESTERYYGFLINKTIVVDTAFLFSTEIVPYSGFSQKAKSLFEALFDFARKNKVSITGTRIFNSQRISESAVKISAGIAVTSYVHPPGESGIMYKTMPWGKNLLETSYTGPYKGVDRAYKALEDYSKDYGLMNMAIPFEKYLTPGYGFEDTQVVQLKVYYPYF